MNLACQSSSSEVSIHGVKMSTTSCGSGFTGGDNFERKDKSEALGMHFEIFLSYFACSIQKTVFLKMIIK